MGVVTSWKRLRSYISGVFYVSPIQTGIEMRYDTSRSRFSVGHFESRHSIDIPADLIIEQGEVLHASLVNFSRHGARLHVPGDYASGQTFRLEVAGWPALDGRVVWSEKGRVGCRFDQPPSQKTFTSMCASATACDREGL